MRWRRLALPSSPRLRRHDGADAAAQQQPGLIDSIIGWQRQAEQKAELERQRAVKIDLIKQVLKELPRYNAEQVAMACGTIYPNAVSQGLIDMETHRAFFRACSEMGRRKAPATTGSVGKD